MKLQWQVTYHQVSLWAPRAIKIAMLGLNFLKVVQIRLSAHRPRA
jgi:hypothetical protein